MNNIQKMPMKKGDVIAFDCGYIYFKQFATYCIEGIYFVTRLKINASYRVLQEYSSEKYELVEFDRTIVITGNKAVTDCPCKLRIIKSYDPDTDKHIILLTNQFNWSPKTIPEVYMDRWKIDIFFKTIKQNLKRKNFFGTGRNAVLTRIWIIMTTSILMKYLTNPSSKALTAGALMTAKKVLIYFRKDIWLWLNKPKLEDSYSGNENFQFDLEF